jgi:hypothetical protein
MRRLRIAAALLALAPLAAPAHAAEPVETALIAWVDAIDASPDWRASYGSLATDAASGRATLSGLSISAEKPGFLLSADRVTIDGYAPTTDGTFAAREMDLDGLRLDAGVYSIRFDHTAIEAPVLPTTGTFAWNPDRPFGSAFAALAPLVAARANSARINTATIVETLSGIETQTTYQQVVAQGIQNGRIAAVTAGAMRTDSPTSKPGADGATPLPPLVTMTAASAETRDIDLNAMLAVYDPARYVNGAGDGVWRTTVGHAAYTKVAVDVIGIAISIDSIAFDNFSLRQPKKPLNLDAPPPSSGTPKISDAIRGLDALAPYGIGKLTVTNLDVTTPGIDRMHLDGLSLSEASTDYIGAFSATGIEAGVSGQGLVKVGLAGFTGLTLPPFALLADALDTYVGGGDVDVSSLMPPIAGVEASDVDVAVNNFPAVQLGHLKVDLGNYVDYVPTSVAASLAGANIPASLVPDDRAQKLLAKYGYDRVVLDGGGKADWAANGDVTLRDMSLGMKGVGLVSGEADLTAPAPTDMAHMAAVASAPETVSLKSGTVSFKDDSLVEKAIGAQAAILNIDPAKFREQFAKGLPFMLMLLGNKDLQAQLATVLQTFIRTPGTITAKATPAQPVTIAALIEAAKTAPFSLFDTLKLSITGVAGPAPVAPPVEAPAAPQQNAPGTTPAN